MKKKARVFFKPSNNLHFQLMSIYFLIPLFFDVGFFIVLHKKFDVLYFIVCLILSILPFFLYYIVRVLYPYKYEIHDDYLIKYKNKRIIFKIRLDDIAYLIIKKANFLNYLKFICGLVIADFSTKNLTTMSIIYKKCETIDTNIKYEFERNRITCYNDINMEEYVDVLSYKMIKRVSLLINKEYKII